MARENGTQMLVSGPKARQDTRFGDVLQVFGEALATVAGGGLLTIDFAGVEISAHPGSWGTLACRVGSVLRTDRRARSRPFRLVYRPPTTSHHAAPCEPKTTIRITERRPGFSELSANQTYIAGNSPPGASDGALFRKRLGTPSPGRLLCLGPSVQRQTYAWSASSRSSMAASSRAFVEP